MATLAFNVQADYDKVRRLSEELARLKTELRAVEENGTPEAVEELEKQISSCRAEMKTAVKAAAELGTAMEQSVKQMDFSTVEGQINALSLAIHENEQVIGQTEQRVAELKTQYEQALSAGDTQAVEAITREVREQMLQFVQLTQQTEEYKQTLAGLTEGGVDTSLEGTRQRLTEVGLAATAEAEEIERLKEEYQKLQTQLVMHVQQGTQEHKNILQRMQAVDGEITARQRLLNELKEQDAALEESISHMEKEGAEVKKASEQHASLRTQIRLLKEQMADMRANGIDEQSEAYRKLSLELGRLQDIQGDIQRQGSILANDERQFAGITSGLQGMSSGFYAVQGAMAVFGTENKNLQAVLSKTYSLMAVVNALQQVSAMLNKDSAFRLVTLANAREWWNKVLEAGRGTQVADTVATQADTVAKQANTAAQQGNSVATGTNTAAQTAQTGAAVAGTAANITLAGAFRMVGAAIKSIPVFGWIAAGISAIVAVTATFIKRANEAKKAAQEFYKALSEEVYKPIGAVRQLALEWERLGDSMEEKQKYIEQNREKLDQLGVVIRDVNDVERLLIDNADAFIQAQIAKARATVYLQQAMEAEKSIAEKEAKRDDLQRTQTTSASRTKWNWKKMSFETEWGEFGSNDKEIAKLDEEIGKEEKKIEDLYGKAIDANKEAVDIMAQNGLVTTEEAVEGSANKIKAKIQSLQRDLENNYKVGSEGYNRVKKEIDALQEQLNAGNDNGGGSRTTTRVTDNTEKEAKEREKIQKRLNESLLSMQAQNQQAEIDLMEEGTEKKLAQLEFSYKQQIEKVKELARELAEENAQAGIGGTNDNGLTNDQQNAINRQILLLGALYKQQREGIEETQLQAEEKAWNEYLIKYGDYLEKREALRRKYESAISEAQTEGEVETLKREYEAALYDLDNSVQQTTSLIGQLFADMSKKTVRELENIIDSAELVMKYLEAERDEEGNAVINGKVVGEQDILDLGLTPETLQRLRESPQDMEALRKAIQNVRKELGQKSPFEKLKTDIKDALGQIKDGALGDGLMNIASSLNEFLPTIEQFGEDLSTIFGDDKIANGINGITGAIRGLDTVASGVGSIMSGDIFGGVTGAVSGIAGIFSSLGSLFSRDSDKHYERDMERLTLSNEALKESVDNLADIMDDKTTSLADALEIYTTQIANVEEQMANTQEQLQRSGSAYSNGFLGIGGHHSSNTKINDAMSASEWAKISEVAGKSVTSASDFWNLTSEQMYKVRTEASTLYAKIKDLADDGYKDAAQYMDEYTEYWKQLEEITNEYYSKLTNTSFDSLADSFKSAVSDMSHTAADFADDFEELMKNAVIDSLMTSKYNESLQQWYEDFALAMEDNGTLDAQEQQALKDSYMKIVNDARNEIESLYDTLGWSRTGYAQQGSAGGWNTMSEDTGQELNGRFTALQETGVQLLEEARQQRDIAERIIDINVQAQAILADSYLELQSINENTASTVEHLVAIVKQAKLVKANTDKL